MLTSILLLLLGCPTVEGTGEGGACPDGVLTAADEGCDCDGETFEGVEECLDHTCSGQGLMATDNGECDDSGGCKAVDC